ncbi:hypothetical protein SAMN02745181_1609 [Rubritalea squalenifaciens DSM 18772]|uniref:ABC-2 family transporter protein n=1 Tax=Rubritalea squalenifaciens DSM 18772 TaxID=1123071 RepID=A0A1M6HXR6_9BACT|nr:hypothetical protein [Rubritalea squalenifaciens]SHJ26938.1 hypothetical protein SAMN02745181_1609 [Rubritalea squalenifaciens DSM 18772]
MNAVNEQTADQVAPESPLLRIFDFPDKISPMLVKELRQGLRGWGFVSLFIALQAIMLLFMLTLSLSKNYGDLGQDVSSMIFLFFSLAALVIQPLRGMSSLSTEIKDDTIDLMVMTKLSAWRITLGKWVSLFSQTLLLLTALLPYLILRYFFGGMQLIPELLMLFVILVLSGVSTALAVGLSALPSIILRGGAMLAVVGFSTIAIFGLFADSSSTTREILTFLAFETEGMANFFLGLLVISIYSLLFFLDFGASQIAPKAENRATPRRIVGTILLLLSFFVFSLNADETAAAVGAMFTIIAAGPLLMFSMNEPMELAPRVVRPFLNKGLLGTLSSRLLYPGWCAGSFYSVFFLALCYSIFVIILSGVPHKSGLVEMHTVIINLIGIFIAPALMARVFWRNSSNPFSTYLIFFGGLMILSIIAKIIDEASVGNPSSIILFWLPNINFFDTISSRAALDEEAHLILSLIVTGAYTICLLIISSIRGRKIYGEIEAHMRSVMKNKVEANVPNIPEKVN